MNQLIQELQTPTRDSNGTPVGPTNLNRRAANAISQLISVNTSNALVLNTLQKELNDYKNNSTSESTATSDPSSDPAQYKLFE